MRSFRIPYPVNAHRADPPGGLPASLAAQLAVGI